MIKTKLQYPLLTVALMLSGCGGSSDREDVNPLEVQANNAPIIVSEAKENARTSIAYNYTISATDADGDTLTYSASMLPNWLSLDSATGDLSGTPSMSDIGGHEVSIEVSDGEDQITQSFTITVIEYIVPKFGEELLANSTFDDASDWTVISMVAEVDGNLDMVSINEGVVTFTTGVLWQEDAIYTQVELTKGTYQLDLDITHGSDMESVWGQVEIGSNTPIDGEAYSGDVGNVLNTYNSWDCGDDGADAYSGPATAGTCQEMDANGRFNITTVGTYYVVFRSGGISFGETGAIVDNLSLKQELDAANAPEIISTAQLTATAGTEYSYTLEATDFDGDTLTLSATVLPEWLSFDPTTGVLSGTPTSSDIGSYDVTLKVSDGSEKTDNAEQSFTIIVEAPVTSVPTALSAIGSFDNANDWTVISMVTHDEANLDMVAIADGMVKFTAGVAWQEAAFYASVELPIGTYQVDLDVIHGSDMDSVWGQIEVGSNDPVDGEAYSGDVGNVLNVFNSWDCGDDASAAYSGPATTGTCQELDADGRFNISTAGTYYVVFKSGGMSFGEAGVLIDNLSLSQLTDAVNAPKITSTVIDMATTDIEYSYQLEAIDFDDDMLTLSVTVLPSWLSFDTTTGVLSGTPTEDDIGLHDVTLMVSDGVNNTDDAQQSFTISVVSPALHTDFSVIGSFDNADDWTVISMVADDEANIDMVTIDAGSVTFNTGTAWQGAAIYTSLELTAGIYQFDMDVTHGDDLDSAWGQIEIGANVPVDGTGYSGDIGSVLNVYNSWDCSTTDAYSGVATASSCQEVGGKGQFEITEDGTYYILFRSGAMSLGAAGVVLDNWSINEVEPVVEIPTDLTEIGTFDDAGDWNVISMVAASEANLDMVTIEGGVTTFTTGTAWQGAAIYTPIELAAGTYQFDMDVTHDDDLDSAWGQIEVGSNMPIDGEAYSGNIGNVLNVYNSWDCSTSDAYTGLATASSCQEVGGKGQFEITEAGIYYILFRSGAMSLGAAGVVLDNWSINEVEPVVEIPTDLTEIGTFDDAGDWNVISMVAASEANLDMVTIEGGVTTFTTGTAWQGAAIYTPIELAAGTYQFDMDVTHGDDLDSAWGQIEVGSNMPIDGEAYSGNIGNVLNVYNSWDCSTSDAYTGLATASSCKDVGNKGQFEITEAGTYYILFRSGAMSLGSAGVVLDNWTLVAQ